jgi:hypothetical protein
LAEAAVATKRALYFSENSDQTTFFITVDGQKPEVFAPDNPPAIETTQSPVEEWTIQNRSQENHEFHIHQIHFMVMSQNDFQINGSHPVQASQGQMLDMIEIPFWDGNPAHPYPSVTLRMDFRGHDIGDFVFHCHILNHEDEGMMAIIRVLPGPATTPARSVMIYSGSPMSIGLRDLFTRPCHKALAIAPLLVSFYPDLGHSLLIVP